MNVSNTGRELEYAFTRLSRIIFLLPASVRVMDISRISFDVYAAETPGGRYMISHMHEPQYPNYLESIKTC